MKMSSNRINIRPITLAFRRPNAVTYWTSLFECCVVGCGPKMDTACLKEIGLHA